MQRLSKDEAVAQVRAERGEAACLICTLVAVSTTERSVVAERAGARLLIPRYALRRGHVLVVAEEHVTRFRDLSPETWAAMSTLALEAARALEDTLQAGRVYVASLGTTKETVPMSSPHLHMHVVPLKDDAERPSTVFTWDGGVFVLDEADREVLRAELRSGLRPAETAGT
jgi:diadenosine tetraphosphate (Ap4A) HIT family hydrolase